MMDNLSDMNQDSKPLLKSILKNYSKNQIITPKIDENDFFSLNKQKKNRVMFKNDEEKNYPAESKNNSSGLKESRQKVNTLPTINDRNTQLKSFETVFQNWIISQSFPEIPKSAFCGGLNNSFSNSVAQEDIRLSYRNTPDGIEKLGSSCNVNNLRMVNKEREARKFIDKAIKDGKIYLCNGPYPCFRIALNKRGWLEQVEYAKYSPAVYLSKMISLNTTKELPLFYQSIDAHVIEILMSLLKNKTPNLFYTVKTTEVINASLKPQQIVNHYAKASSFTTKVGLTENLKLISFVSDKEVDDFYPRCYHMLNACDKQAFFDDFRFTACVSFLKHFVYQCKNSVLGKKAKTPNNALQKQDEHVKASSSKAKCSKDENLKIDTIEAKDLKKKFANSTNIKIKQCASNNGMQVTINLQPTLTNNIKNSLEQLDQQLEKIKSNTELNKNDRTISPLFSIVRKSKRMISENFKGDCNNDNNNASATVATSNKPKLMTKHISVKALKYALNHCEKFLDKETKVSLKSSEEVAQTEAHGLKEWMSFLDAYKLYANNTMPLDKSSRELYERCLKVANQLEAELPQYKMDGFFNVWIIKPGAKSRGREIKCSNSYEEITNIATAMKNCVVQKYIERPLLIYKTKFDLRLWFLVTDVNPLTLWFYKDFYLRFCSEDFTLSSFHEAIHLSNNSIQKNYQVSSTRSPLLPKDNMWTGDEFKAFLNENYDPNAFDKKILPQMEDCIINVLLCTQDVVENRKNSFEMYGADFMIDEDLKVWLIEVNCSPSMARTTSVTSVLVEKVLEDSVKVIVDRRTNPSADTGGFHIVYQQKEVTKHQTFNKDHVIKADKIKAIYNAVAKS